MHRSLTIFSLLLLSACSVEILNEHSIQWAGKQWILASSSEDCPSTDASSHELPGSTGFYTYLGISVLLVMIAGIMSGLTVGLFSIDPLKLELMKIQGDSTIKRQAEALQPILSKHHLLLVTLLLTNAVAMEALPIFLDALVPSYVAIILSVTFVLFFGEVIPQALCTKNPLSIGAKFAWLVRLLMIILSPIAWPIGKLLDWILGHGEARNILFKRSELKALVDIHASADGGPFQLSPDEALILKGALDLKRKQVVDAMTTFEDIFMLNFEDKLTFATMARILAAGFSRIPVYSGSRHNIVGIIMVKRLIVVDPEEARPLKHLSLRQPFFVYPDASLYDMLNQFQEGKSHLAIVTNDVEECERCFQDSCPVPDFVKVLGIITIEDVVEEIIQEEIEDEDDVSLAHHAAVEKRVTDIVSQEVGVQRAVGKFKSMLNRSKKRRAIEAKYGSSQSDDSTRSRIHLRKANGREHSVESSIGNWIENDAIQQGNDAERYHLLSKPLADIEESSLSVDVGHPSEA